jgi:hypothetical protein
MTILQAILLIQFIGALLATLLMQHGLVRYCGQRFANPLVLILLFIVQNFIWTVYLIGNPMYISRMMGCTFLEAMDTQNQGLAHKINNLK